MVGFHTQGFLLLLLLTVTCQVDAQECSTRRNCNDCIATAGCSWCSSLTFRGDHCGTGADLRAQSCDAIEDTRRQQINITRSGEENPINVTSVRLSLRVGEPRTFTVRVTPLQNTPLDLYILIDLSASMTEELSELKMIAGDIANQIRNVTNNVRIGFGSFNDKVTRPYTYFPVPETPGGTCPMSIPCGPNYAFRHQITLTDNITFYNETVQGINTTTNADRPENGLEGLAQVVACEKIIGWRNRSASGMDRGQTRIVLFMTDDAFHYAGEGQLAGILKPYRGECLLDPPPSGAGRAGATEFTRWREVDYPSVGQIVQMLRDKQVSVIFAVTQPRLQTYSNLANLTNLWSSASVALLTNKSDEILNLTNREIENILQRVSLIPDLVDEQLNYIITPSCPTGSPALDLPNGGGCDDIRLGTPVEFQITVNLSSCDGFPEPGTFRTQQIISPGFGTIDIIYTGECQCSCELNAIKESLMCSGNGDFVCGVCECYNGWCGDICDMPVPPEVDNICEHGGPSNELCSGPDHGTCDCSCNCLEPYFGPACECDASNSSICPTNVEGVRCSGQGDCCDGRCRCRRNENGFFYRHNGINENCACPPREEVCLASVEDDVECSGNGNCGCNGCICNSRYFGTFCQTQVTTCTTGNSMMDRRCIEQCIEANFDVDTCMSCDSTRPLIVVRDNVPTTGRSPFLQGVANRELMDTLTGNESYIYELDCQVRVNCPYYLLRGPETYALILPVSDGCNSGGGSPFPAYAFAPIIFGVLLIIGILIFVLARIILSILDYLEVKKFQLETKNADFSQNQNPLYQSPKMKYENVAYGQAL